MVFLYGYQDTPYCCHTWNYDNLSWINFCVIRRKMVNAYEMSDALKPFQENSFCLCPCYRG